jgi:hypothetical protein
LCNLLTISVTSLSCLLVKPGLFMTASAKLHCTPLLYYVPHLKTQQTHNG